LKKKLLGSKTNNYSTTENYPPEAATITESTGMTFTEEELEAAEKVKAYDWSARSRPAVFDPIQLRTGKVVVKCLDWWNTRSTCCCCLYPFLRCCGKQVEFDATNLEVWREQLKDPINKKCPKSMQGVWWLAYNHAPEELVTIFSDAEFTGTFNEEGTDGYGYWSRPLLHNWSRENSLLGLGFAVALNEKNVVKGMMNLKDGIATVRNADGSDGQQVIYKVDDDEWWKIHYNGDVGQEGQDEIYFQYKWFKVMDGDGNTTKHYDEFVDWTKRDLPHGGCGCGDYTSCLFPCWGSCLSQEEIHDNMIMPNKSQVANFHVDVSQVMKR
jgi:hypothetical protein